MLFPVLFISCSCHRELCCPSELVAKCLRRVWSKDQLLKSRLKQEMFSFYYMSKIIFVIPLLVVINQRVFQNSYHCFNPEVRGWMAGLQNWGLSTAVRRDTSLWFHTQSVLKQHAASAEQDSSQFRTFDLMWCFGLDPTGSVLLHCNFPFSSFPCAMHSCPRSFCHLNLSSPVIFFVLFLRRLCAFHWQFIISLSA